MKKFTDAIKGALKKMTHHHKGLPPTHTASPIEESVPNAPTVETVIPVASVATSPEKKKHHHKHKSKSHDKVAVDPVSLTTEKKKHHHKHKSKPRGKVAVAPTQTIDESAANANIVVNVSPTESVDLTVQVEQPINIPTEAIAKPRGKVAVRSFENADDESTSRAVKIAEETPASTSIETVEKIEPVVIAEPSIKLSEVVLMLGEKNESKAKKASELIEKRQSKELIFSGEGVDQYGLRGRLLPDNPHRLKVTSQGLHYLTTQEAVDEMNAVKKAPRGKVAPTSL